MYTAAEYQAFYEADDPQRLGRDEMPEQRAITSQWLIHCAEQAGPVLELGCGRGALAEVHPEYVGLDFSKSGLKKFRSSKRRVNGDMQRLPIRTASIRCVFSWAAIEHVPNPELVLEEVCRILRPGGLAILAPAWNCRSWAAEGLPVRSYQDLTWIQRAQKATIPIRDHIIWRAAWAVPRRLFRELGRLRGHPTPFKYHRLRPNLTEYVYTDCDAFTSMDPHSSILFFETRGWDVLSHPTALARLFARHEPVVVRKPK